MNKITVIIANHNYGVWLDGAIKSASTEGTVPLNICVIDDGSTDNSLDVLKNIALWKAEPTFDVPMTTPFNGHTLQVIKNKKSLGPSAARNLGIKLNWNNTDVFAILDADDLYLPGKLSKSIAALNSDINIGGVYTDYDIFNVDTGVFHREYKEPYSLEKLYKDCIIHSACVLRKEALEFAGLYREDMRTCEDYELWARMSKKYLFYHIAEPLMIVRSGNHSSSNYRSKQEWQQNWQKVAQTFNGQSR